MHSGITYKIFHGPSDNDLKQALTAVGKYIDLYWQETKWQGAPAGKINIEWIVEWWRNNGLHIAVVYDKTEPVGFLLVSIVQGMLHGETEAHTIAIYLDSKYRDKNIAGRLGLFMRKHLIDNTTVDVVFYDRLVSLSPYEIVSTIVFNRHSDRGQ